MYLTQTPFWTQRVSMTEMHEFIYMRDPSKCYNTHTHTRRYIHTQASRFLFKLSNFSFREYNAYNIELHLGYTGSERDGYAYTNTNWSAYSKTCTSECILKVAKEMKKKWKWAPHVWILWIVSNQFWVCLTIPNAKVNRFDSETPARST